MAAILVIGLGWFLIILVCYLMGKQAGWKLSLGIVVVWCVLWNILRPEDCREPSFPRPTGDSMEDRFRQNEWDEIKEGLNAS